MKNKSLSAIIIGNGSIGKRHFKILNQLKVQTYILSSRDFLSNKISIDFKKFNLKKTIFFICNNTNLHFYTLKKIAKKHMNIFIEKPLISDHQDLKITKKLIKNLKLNIFTGYLFRHDPRILKLKKIVNEDIKNILLASFSLQTYMPNWHPEENYRNKYANRKKYGGGVLLTCSHEIDLAIYLFGDVNDIIVKKVKSSLKNDVESSVLLILSHKNGIISQLNLDFSNDIGFQRTLEIKANKKIYKLDFKKKYLEVKTKKNLKKINIPSYVNLSKIYVNQIKKVIKNINIKKDSKILETEKLIFQAKKKLN